MKQLTPKIKFYLTLIAVFVGLGAAAAALLALFFIYIQPLATDFAKIQHDIHVAEGRIDYVKKIIEPGIQRSSKDLQVVQNSFYMPSYSDAYNVILFVESTGTAQNVSAKITNPPSETARMASAKVSGTFGDILKFFRALENSERLIKIDTLSLQASGDTASATFTFTLPTL